MPADRGSSLRPAVRFIVAWCLVALVATPLPAQDAPAPDRPRGGAAPAALPDGVEQRSVTIWSDGTRMAGDLYLPRDRTAGEKLPGVVFCAGTGGTKQGTGRRLGPIFAARGYVALAFDYRGWGASESQLMAVDPQPAPSETGEMTIRVRPLRWQMNYTDQTEDIRAAISFLAGEPDVDSNRIGIMGSSYGGGLVTWVAGHDPRVKCVVAQVPGLGGARPAAAEKRMYELHMKQARGETEPVPIETGKLGGKMARYDQMRVNPAKNIAFSAAEAAARLAVPALFVVAENEELSDNETVRRVHEGIKARGVPTDFLVIKNITHYGIYREGFEEATRAELAWFDRHLAGVRENPTPPEEAEKPKAPPAQDAAAESDIDLESGREFWAFRRPVRPEIPAVLDADWPRGEIDRFVQAARERQGLTPAGDADPRTLIRRLSFDLVGLPPTPEEVRDFLAAWQRGPEAAFTAAVDRLLASPHFGERWGRHWLDVARYAESSGKETSFSYPEAWRYRDYVIESFNADLPFDRFVREQLAGDLLPAASDSERARRLVATGFLALGPKSHVERTKLQFEMDVVDEQIDAVSLAFLGLTVACARCHDHKFDPVSQRDYYALAGIFRSTDTFYGTIPVIQNNNPGQLLPLPESAGMPAGRPPLSAADREKLEAQLAELRAERRAMTKDKRFATSEFVRNGIVLATQQARLASFTADGAPRLVAMGVKEHAEPRDSELFVRGEVEKPAATVPRGFVQVLCDGTTPTITGGSGRRELATWIASADNPLTARVFVNRVWLNLFGRGLVPTPDNFGMSGQSPSHPDLLDHLAVTFVDDGWSPKRLIRRIVTSRTYRLASTLDEARAQTDPDNQWLWRMSPRRLDAEAIRDAMLATAGTLDLKPPVGSAVAREGEGYTAGLDRGGQLAERNFTCRAVYLPAIRGRPLESLDVFDGVDGSLVTGQREQTTVPIQSLYLLNSPPVLALAATAASRLAADAPSPAARVELAYERWFGRPPTDAERETALSFVARYRDEAATARPGAAAEFAAWTAFCQSLWASGEFLVRR